MIKGLNLVKKYLKGFDEYEKKTGTKGHIYLSEKPFIIFQKELEVLKIFIRKNVIIRYLKESQSARDYNKRITETYKGVKYSKCNAIKLTQKEHTLCKEVLSDE